MFVQKLDVLHVLVQDAQRQGHAIETVIVVLSNRGHMGHRNAFVLMAVKPLIYLPTVILMA
jgi:hypothetical protein